MQEGVGTPFSPDWVGSNVAQMVMLGSGDAKYESAMRAAEAAQPRAFRGWVGFSIPVAHRIIAGEGPEVWA